MDKKLKIGLIILGVILILLLLNYSGAFFSLNKYFTGTPDKTCAVDSDCALKGTTCGYCNCGDAVNKNWDVSCPFKRNPHIQVLCKMCPSPNIDFDIKCVDNQCQRVWKNN
jgi:hypothetical protein